MHRGLVDRLVGREPGHVDGVVHARVDAGVELVDLGAVGVRVELGLAGGQVAEARGQHAQDVGGLVVDDPLGPHIPEHGDAEASLVGRVGGDVGLAEELEAVDRVYVLAAGEGPGALVADGIGGGHADDRLEALQQAPDDRPVRPGTGPGDVQVVTAGLGQIGR